MSELLRWVADRAAEYHDKIDDRTVAPTTSSVDRLAELDTPLQDEPVDAADVLRCLDEIGSPATMAMAGGRYFGFVIGGSVPAAEAASWLVDTWDQNSALSAMSPVAVRLEDVAMRWVIELLGLPASSHGVFVTGATMANFTGLAAARSTLLRRAGWNVEEDGLFGAPDVSVVVGEEAHSTLFKALALAGLGRKRVHVVPVDSQGRIRSEALPPMNDRTIVCIQAGNVNTGSFDPASDICTAAKAAGAWVHVDGAFGMWAAVAPTRAHLVNGFAEADSWATDAHKWLNVTYDCGIALVRDPEHLRSAMSVSAAYLPVGQQREPIEYTPEASRRARGVPVWAAIRSLGRSGVADIVERTCRHAQRFAEGLASAGFEILNDVVINQVLVSFGEAGLTQRVIAAIQADGTCWCGGTVWQGRTAMRISVSSWKTTDEDVEKSLTAMIRVARNIISAGNI